MMRKIILILVLLFASAWIFTSINQVFAQGTARCGWNVSSGKPGCSLVNQCESANIPPAWLVDYCPAQSDMSLCLTGDQDCVSLGASPTPPSYIPSKPNLRVTGPCPGLTGKAKTDCENCVTNKNGAYTALGCVPTDPSKFVEKLLGWVMGIAGGIAFLLILYGGFQIVTSTGDPEKLNNGKEIIASALAGLLMIVFSVLLLKIIGVDILKIPGF